jgi:arginyl-tRNA synthetase
MESIKQKIVEELEETLELDVDEDDIEIPDAEHGDFAYPVMKVAGKKGENPRELAEELKKSLELEKVEKIEVAGPGYLNFFIDRENYSKDILESVDERSIEEKDEKVIVEHTSPNPNKPLHMGTMRAAVLGDTIARLGDYSGYEIEVQNFMNDLGRQIAKVVYGHESLLEEVSEEDRAKKDDFWIGLLYSETGHYIDENTEEEEKVNEIIQKMEEAGNKYAELKDELVEKSLKGQLQTAYNTNIFYDFLIFERNIVEYGLLDEAMEKIQELDCVYEVEEGEDEGCLVIDISDYEDEIGELQKPYKILKRSDGTAVYTGKDIALTMWKFGLLDSQFQCEIFEQQPNGEPVWKTGGDEIKDFGDADKVINVIASRQSYPMKVIKYGLKALGYEEESESFHHAGFKYVYLPGKVAYSGRKGNWVGKHGDAVLEKCQEMALEEIQDRYDFSEEKEKEISGKVATAAVRYFILKFSNQKDIEFSFEKALDWEGDSGPYLLYSNARAHGIVEKSEENPEFSTYEKDIEYRLIRKLSEFEEVVEKSFESQEPTKLTHYLKELAEEFNSFYHSCPVNSAETEKLKKSRLKITEGFVEVMEEGLQLLGIEPLEEM